MSLFPLASLVSLFWTKSSATHLAPSGQFSDIIYHDYRKKSTDLCCIPSLTSISSDNSEYTLTLVFAPSYILITDLTKTSGIPFFLIANSNISLIVILVLQHSQDGHCINCSSFRHDAILHLIATYQLFYKAVLHHPVNHLHSMLEKLHGSHNTAVPDVNLPFEDWNHYFLGPFS